MAGENGIIFGLDFPYNRQPEIMEGLEAVKAMDCEEAVKEKILGGNLRRILGIEHERVFPQQDSMPPR